MLLRFSEFELDEERFELRLRGEPVPVQPRVLETIQFLARHPEQLVTKEQLIAGPWRGLNVSDSALSQAIKQARQALSGDAGDAPIVTVRGKGFRFQQTVTAIPLDRMSLEADLSPGHAAASEVDVGRGSRNGGEGVRRFAGRERELDALRAAQAAARAGQGNVVLISGSAGVGKTRLVSELALVERRRGGEVCWGGCREGQATLPYWPWPEVVGRYAETRDDETVRALTRGVAPELAVLLPQLAELLGVAPSRAPEHPLRTLAVTEAVITLFRRAAAEACLTLVLEDVHLADQASLQLFEAFARSIGDTRLLIIATCRDEEARARRELCSALAGAWPHVQRLELEGLGVREVGAWLQSVATRLVPDGVIAALHSSTGGLPLLLENLLQAPETEWNNEAIAVGTLDGRLPQRVMRVLSHRFAGLDPEALELLRMASVFGEEIPLAALAEVSQKEPAELLPKLERAAQLGIVAPLERGQVRFAHALQRDVLYQQLSSVSRLNLHLKVARALAARLGHRPEWIVPTAHHFVEAAPLSQDGEAVGYARRAAEWARRQYAYAAATQCYKKALDVFDWGSADPRIRCELLVGLAETLSLAGNAEASGAAYEQYFELNKAHRFEDLFCRALWGIFSMRRDSVIVDPFFQEQLGEALRFLTEGSVWYAPLQVARSLASTFRVGFLERVGWVQDALRAVRARDDHPARLEVLRGAVYCNTYFTDGTTLLGLAEETVRAASEAQSPESQVEAGIFRSHALLELGRGQDYLQQVADCARLAQVLRSAQLAFVPTMLQAGAAFVEGDLARAERLARQAGALGQGIGPAASAYLCGELCIIGAEKDGAERSRVLEEAALLGESVLAVAPKFYLQRVAVARIRLALGEERPARELLESLRDPSFVIADPLDRNYLGTLAMLSLLACALGDREHAEQMLRLPWAHEERHAVASTGTVYFGPACHWLGVLHLKAGRIEAARRYLERAVDESARAQSTLYVAWSQFYLAQVLGLSVGAESRRHALLASARRAARRHALGHLEHMLRRVDSNPQAGGKPVFRT